MLSVTEPAFEHKLDKPYRRYARMCARVIVDGVRRIYDGAGDTGERLREP